MDPIAGVAFADAGCTFLEHLSGVADVLATWGEPESVSLAGLFHSIYGTELFQGLQPAETLTGLHKVLSLSSSAGVVSRLIA